MRRLIGCIVVVASIGVAVWLAGIAGSQAGPALQPISNCEEFVETGKKVCGRFLEYWREHGGLAQQGYPLSEEFVEKSDLNGKEYTVQYFERAVFELHPENKPPYDVLLSQLGTFQYKHKYPNGDPSKQSSRPGTLAPAGAMSTPRACHSATLLRDGTVLVAGGMERNGVFWASAEIYDPATRGFKPVAGSMVAARACHAAVMLEDGRVFMAGGSAQEWHKSTELYDPRTGRFTAGSDMSVRRGDVSAVLLKDGRVLVAGGYDGTRYATAELYDPKTGRFTPTGQMSQPRSQQTATLLRDGRVLLVGGTGADRGVLALAELYDPATGRFTTTGSLTSPRHKHAATLLPDGRVLVVGGSDARDWRGQYASAELYDLATGKFSPTGNMRFTRFKITDALAILQDGRVFVGGGNKQPEIYNPATSLFTTVQGQADANRFFSTSTLLSNGQVLLLGGYDEGIEATRSGWVFTP